VKTSTENFVTNFKPNLGDSRLMEDVFSEFVASESSRRYYTTLMLSSSSVSASKLSNNRRKYDEECPEAIGLRLCRTIQCRKPLFRCCMSDRSISGLYDSPAQLGNCVYLISMPSWRIWPWKSCRSVILSKGHMTPRYSDPPDLC
jgi:hypothetical protein